MQTDVVELTIQVPAAVADSDAAERARLLLVLDAVRREKMTFRAGARALSIAPDAFLDLARAHGIPIIRYESADLETDLTTLGKIQRGRTL